MNTKNYIQSAALTVLSVCSLSSCNDKDDLFQKTEPKEGLAVINCSNYKEWKFFSFAQDTIIGTCDAQTDYDNWKNRTDWDLGFHRQDVKTNSGVSGAGTGGILEYNFEGAAFNFDAVKIAPITNYQTDVQDSIVYDMSNMMQGIIGYAKTGLAQPPKQWAVLEDMQNSKWVYAQKVFIVRTADGKYAKIYLQKFKNEKGNSGTVTMQYVYQSDGSANLDKTQQTN